MPALRRPSATPARPRPAPNPGPDRPTREGETETHRPAADRVGPGRHRGRGDPAGLARLPREPARRHAVPRPDRPPDPPLRGPARQQHDHMATDQRALFDPYNLQRWAHQQRLRSEERTPTAPPLTCKNNPHDQLIRESPRAPGPIRWESLLLPLTAESPPHGTRGSRHHGARQQPRCAPASVFAVSGRWSSTTGGRASGGEAVQDEAVHGL